MNKDNYGEIINGEQTYDEIAKALKDGESVIIGWTDEQGSHFDILFNMHAVRKGSQIQFGIRPETDLFVSIMRVGSFAFEINQSSLHTGYVNEKFGNFFGENITSASLTKLINEIKIRLI